MVNLLVTVQLGCVSFHLTMGVAVATGKCWKCNRLDALGTLLLRNSPVGVVHSLCILGKGI